MAHIPHVLGCDLTVLRQRILVSQGTDFGRMFKTCGALRNIDIEETVTESLSSLGLGKRYHEPLRTTYRKMKIAYPNVIPELMLSCSVNAMNVSLGTEVLVPSVLGFVDYPSVRTITEPLKKRPTLSSRDEIAMTIRKEMFRIMVKQRTDRGLQNRVLVAADKTYSQIPVLEGENPS